MKRFLKQVNKIMLAVAGSLVWFAIFCFASPEPTAWYLRKLFAQSEYSRPKDYDEIAAQTQIDRDIDYGSAYPQGKLDVIRPKGAEGKLPVVFWVHGGAYVGGDKEETEPYCVCIAAHGYVVVNINYALAPETQYPAQIVQIGEAYSYFRRHAKKYDADMGSVFFAGDSAGAQMLSVFLNVETSPEYAQRTGIRPVVEDAAQTIRGGLLFCGPYELTKLAEIKAPIVGFMLERAAWAYIGPKDWPQTEQAAQNDILDKLTPAFPPTFLTDGNAVSFGEHMERMERELLKRGVPVESVFYPRKERLLQHEYQFNLAEKHAQETFEAVIAFLGERRGNTDRVRKEYSMDAEQSRRLAL